MYYILLLCIYIAESSILILWMGLFKSNITI